LDKVSLQTYQQQIEEIAVQQQPPK
jgi:hypothetical protein